MSVTRSARKIRLSGKSTRHQAIAAISAAASMVAWGAISKADTYGFNDTSTALNTVSPTPWTDETVPSVGTAAPGSGDTAQFDSLAGLGGATVLTLGQNTTWGGLTVLNPGAAITIGNTSGDNTNTLTLGSVTLAGGIDMSGSAQSLTIIDPISINAISQSFTVDSGQILTLNGSVGLSTATSTATLTLGGAGAIDVNGAINDTAFSGGAIAQTGGGTVVLTAANNYSGSTQLASGVMELNFNGGGATTNILPSAAQLRLEGGTLLINGNATGASSQMFSSAATNGPTVVNPGSSIIQVVDNSSGANLPTVVLGTITVNQASTNLGGQVEFIGPATSSDGLNVSPIAATANISVGSTPTVVGSGNILVDTNSFDAFGVVGQTGHPNQVTDFAGVSGGVVTGGSAITGFYTEFAAASSEGAGANADVSATGEFRISSSRTYTTMRFNTPTGGLFNSDGNTVDQVLIKSGTALTTGGILITPNVGANNVAFVLEAAGSYLAASSAALQCPSNTTNVDDLNVFQYNTQGALIINTGIRDSGHTGGYAQSGPGTVEINGSAAAAQFTRPTVLSGGLTILGNFAQGAALGNSSSVNLNGGNLNIDYTGTMDNGTARPINVSPNGGGISATTGNSLTVDGVIGGSGVLGIGYSAIATNEANNATGTITQNLPSSPNTAGNGIVILTGANTYTGGTSVNNGALQIDTGTAGTGPIAVTSHGNLAGTATLTNNATVASGGQLTPGDPITLGPTVGTLGLASLNLNAGSVSNFAFTNTSNFSAVNLTGNLTIANGTQFDVDQSGNAANPFTTTGTYDIFNVTGSITLGTPVFGSNAATYSLVIDPTGHEVLLEIAGSTPETWNTAAGGSWAAAFSWYPSGVPNSVGAEADFLPDVANTANPAYGGVVTLDGNETVGTLIFQNANSFTIAAGSSIPSSVLHIQASGAGSGTITDSQGSHTISAPVSLDSANDNVTVSNSAATLTFSNNVEGIGALTVNPTGAGTVLLSANNTYGGGTTIDGGTLQVGTGGPNGTLGTSTSPIVNKGSLIVDVSANLTLNVGPTPANGTGSITQNGTGTLAFSGTNNAGAFTINAGEVQIAASSSLTTTGDLTMANGTKLDLNGNNVTLGGLNEATGTATIDDFTVAGTPTVTFGGDGHSNTFSGNILNTMGTVAVVKAGTGTETLSAINTYSGGTTITAGALLVTNSSGANSGVGSGTITEASANGLQLGNGVTLENPISITIGSSEFEDVPSGSATLAGAIVATGSNQYRVGTISTSSTLNLTGASTGGTSSIFIITRGNVVVNGSGASITSSHTSSALLIGRQSATSTLNMTIENGGQLNSAFGMEFGSNNAADDGSITLTAESGSSINAGGVFNLNYDATANVAISFTVAGGSSVTAAAFQNLSLQGNTAVLIDGASSIIASANDPAGSAFLPEFSNGNNITAGISINVGTGGAIINNGGFNITIAEPLGDAGGTGDNVTFSGTGTTVLANSNGYAGNTTISAGTVVVANAGGSAFSSGTVAVNGGILASASSARIALLNSLTAATLDNIAAGPVVAISNQVNVGATGTIAPGEVGSIGTMAFSGLSTVSGSTINFDLTTGTGSAPTSATGDLLLLNGGFAIGSGTLLTFGGTPTVGDYYRIIGGSSITTPAGAAAIAAEFTLPAGFSLNTSIDPDFIDLFVSSLGPATLTWNNAGANTPSDGRTWDISNNKNWNSGAPGNVVYTEPGGANNPNVIFSDSNNITPGGTNANAYNVTLNTVVNPGSVTVNNTTGNYTISGTGTIGGTASLTKMGTGTLTLSTPNTYSGGTIVSAGKLIVGQAGSNAVFTGPALSTANTLTALPTGALSISGNGIVQLADGVTNQTFVTPGAFSSNVTSNINLKSLSLTGDGTLDIGNNRILIDYTTGHDPIASIQQWIANGFADGETAGAQPAIISGDIAADDLASGFSYGIGYADGADGLIAGLPSGEIEIMFTLVGDANLDGQVNSEDFTPFSNNLNGSPRSWDQADFNYDGTVNSEDFTPFSHDLNQSAALAASETGTLASNLIVSNGISLTNVPEPASTGLLTAGVLVVLARRRRKAKA